MTFKHIRCWERGLTSGYCWYFIQGLYHILSSCTPGQIISAELLFHILMLLIYMQSYSTLARPYFLNLHLFLSHRAFVSKSRLIEQWGKSWWGCSTEMPNPGRCWRRVYMHKYIHEQQESRIYWCLPLSPELWWGLCQSYFQCSFV